MPRSFLAVPIALAFIAACGGSTDNVAVLDAGAPSATIDPSPPFTEDKLSVAAAPTATTTSPPIPDSSPAPEPTAAPSTLLPLEPAATFDLPGCPDTPRGAVADKEAQRYWLCASGHAITDEIPMTTASGNYGLPPIGTYPVFARDEDAFGIGGEALERFVAFYTTSRGNRIAFHEVVNQDPDSVGDLDQRGESAGCFRVREEDSVQVWDFLQIDDPVVIIT